MKSSVQIMQIVRQSNVTDAGEMAALDVCHEVRLHFFSLTDVTEADDVMQVRTGVAFRELHRARRCVWSADWRRCLTAGRGRSRCRWPVDISAAEVSSTVSGLCRPLTVRKAGQWGKRRYRPQTISATHNVDIGHKLTKINKTE